MISRRGFLGGILAAAAAPAIVRAESLMKVVAPKQGIWTPFNPSLWSIGVDNSEADDFKISAGLWRRDDNVVRIEMITLMKSRIEHAEKQFAELMLNDLYKLE